MNRKRLAATLLFIFSATIVFAHEIIISDEQPEPEPETTVINRVLGNQYINIALGLQIPLFIHNPAASSETDAVQPINLSPGGIFSLGWSVFLENSFSLGLDIGASYSTDPNLKGYFSVPIGINANYFFRFFPFELPLHIGMGIDIISYNDIVTTALLAKAGLSFYWNAFDDWSFGINAMYWWVGEFYGDDNPLTPDASMTRFGNFLEITLSAMYNF